MRLDHLLSKELFSIIGAGRLAGGVVAEARPRPCASGVVAHGWNIDESLPCGVGVLVRRRLLVGTCAWSWGRGSMSTLLGPEATGRGTSPSSPVRVRPWGEGLPSGGDCLRVVAAVVAAFGWGLVLVGCLWEVRVIRWCADQPACRWWCMRCAWWVRPLLENCIVDASIF